MILDIQKTLLYPTTYRSSYAMLPSNVTGIDLACCSKWATSWQNQQNDGAPSEDSGQPGHPPSLIRVFAVRMKKAWVLSYPLSAQRRLWSDWADAQADLSLRWAHMPFCWFCHEVTQMLLLLFTTILQLSTPGINLCAAKRSQWYGLLRLIIANRLDLLAHLYKSGLKILHS